MERTTESKMNTKTLCSNTSFRLVLSLLISTCWGCQKTHVKNFTGSDKRTYFELHDGKKFQNIYTEIQSNRMALIVMDEANKPQLIKVSFPDGAGESNTILLEFTENRDTPSAGKKFLKESFIRELTAADGRFEQWKKGILSFPTSDPKFTMSYVIAGKIGDEWSGIVFTDCNTVASRIKDYYCTCRVSPGACANSGLRCAMNALCDLWENCVDTGDWGPTCNASLAQLKVCSFEQP